MEVHLPVAGARCGTTATGSYLFIYLGLRLAVVGPFTSAMIGADGLVCETLFLNLP